MAHLDFIGALERESTSFAEAARARGGLHRAVSACPGWKVRQLVEHLGGVQRFWAATVRAEGARPDLVDPEPDDRDVLEWYDESWQELAATLRAAAPDAPSWAWWGEGATVADVARRQAHEALVHRWDAQVAAGTPQHFEAALAEDGVAEFFERMVPWDRPWPGAPGTVRFRAGDTGRVWTVRLGPESALLPEGAESAVDASVRCPVSELDLLLWRRLGTNAPGLTLTGDATLVEGFLRWPNLG